ncbi:MAG: hypothetical protein P1P64_02665 [Treponemataceae bacterium]
MEYIEIKNNIVTGHYCGDLPPKREGITVMVLESCLVNIGDDIRIYSDIKKGIKKPLSQLVDEELVKVPEGKKLNEAGDDFVDMTDVEKVRVGLLKLEPTQKIDGDFIIEKSKKELYDDGIITADEYNAYISQMRESAYRAESDKLGLQVLRSEVEKDEWLEKIAEIKKRYPKVK